MRTPPRSMIAALAALVLVTACGSDDNDASAPSSPIETTPIETAPEPTTTPDTAAPTAPAEDPTTTQTPTTTLDPDACREIVHELGTACVPATPQRIVVLDSLTALPTLVEVGAPVVAALSVYGVGDPFPAYLDAASVEGIEVVGTMQTPNIEAILAAEPDLIIGATPIVEPIYDRLEKIAPTVVTPYSFYSSDWLTDVRLVADAAGKSAEIEAQIEALEAREAEVKAALSADGAAPTLSRIDLFQGAPLYYRFGCTWFGQVLTAAGVSQPAAQGPDECTNGDYESVLVYPSLEQLDVLDADAIVAYQQQAGDGDVGADPLDSLSSNPLWAGLPAVQAGRVHVMGDAWGLGASITAALVILDDLETTVFPST